VTIEVGYITFAVQSLDKAKAFFEPLFGWVFEYMPGQAGAHIGNTRMPIGFSIGGPTHYPNVYFKVPSIRETGAQIVELGGKIGSISESPSGLSATCEDDQGTVFALWQPAPGFDG
jgi:predicted enzyme related to lactoylglutathione lyase